MVSLKMYFDMNVYNRDFDDQSQMRIRSFIDRKAHIESVSSLCREVVEPIY